jgi:hypothetical protein
MKQSLPVNRHLDDLIGSWINLDVVEPLRQQVTDSQFRYECREFGRKAAASAAQDVDVTNRAPFQCLGLKAFSNESLLREVNVNVCPILRPAKSFRGIWGGTP